MRIEMIVESEGNMSINGFQSDLAVLINQSNSVFSSLRSVRKFVTIMNGGMGNLAGAVVQLDIRMDREAEKQAKLEQTQEKCENFINLVRQVDYTVSDVVSQNQNEFYHVNEWARPSLLFTVFDTLYSQVSRWFNQMYEGGRDAIRHHWSILKETDFSSLSKEELEKYYTSLKEHIEKEGLSNDDALRLKFLLNYLSKGSFEDKSLYFKVFGMVHSEEMSEIERVISENGYSGNKELWIKYFLTKGTTLSSAEALYEKWTDKKNVISDVTYIDENAGRGGFKQGNFHVEDMRVIKHSDGSCDLSLSAKQTSVSKSYGAVIVYDAEGHVTDIKVLDRYHNPTNFTEACQTIWKDWHGEDYAETVIHVNIPKGGYVQITDDPDEIAIVQTGKITEEVVEDKVKDIVKDEVTDWIKEKTGIGQVGKHATDAVKYRAEVLAQAKEAYEITKKSAEVMDKIEDVYWSVQQKGSGSAILYND